MRTQRYIRLDGTTVVGDLVVMRSEDDAAWAAIPRELVPVAQPVPVGAQYVKGVVTLPVQAVDRALWADILAALTDAEYAAITATTRPDLLRATALLAARGTVRLSSPTAEAWLAALVASGIMSDARRAAFLNDLRLIDPQVVP